MTRAEATARVVAAARAVAKEQRPPRFYKDDDTRKYPVLCDWIDALDACPPEDTEGALDVRVPRDLHDARALAWAGWERITIWRDTEVQCEPFCLVWDLTGDGTGWWPTRDAEHAAWAGRYRAKAISVPSVWNVVASCHPYTAHAGQEAYAPQAGPAPAQSAAPETSSTDARLDALAAQVGRVEAAVRAMQAWADTDSRAVAAILDGGPDAKA